MRLEFRNGKAGFWADGARLAEFNVVSMTHGAGHGSSAAAQSFHNPKHEKTPLVASAARIKNILFERTKDVTAS